MKGHARSAPPTWSLIVAATTLVIAVTATLVYPRLQEETGRIGFAVVAVYPHDAGAFTQGLYFEDGFLFESTGRRGESSLRKVAVETGAVVREIPLPPQYFGEGIAPHGDSIYQLTWTSGVGFVYDKRTFNLERQFTYSREGWGLTGDGTHLVMSDGSQYLYFLDPVSMDLVRQIEVRDSSGPVRELNELEYIQGYIYANVWHTSQILKIDPGSGRVVGYLDLTELVEDVGVSDAEGVLNGIAWDPEGERLFVTGKLWPRLFELRFD